MVKDGCSMCMINAAGLKNRIYVCSVCAFAKLRRTFDGNETL